MDENKALRKQIEAMYIEQAAVLQKSLRSEFEYTEGANFLCQKIDLTDSNAIKTLASNLEKEVGNAVIVFGTESNGKPMLTICISPNLAKSNNLNASNLIREFAQEIKGGGGGHMTFATAGGNDVSGLDKALSKTNSIIRQLNPLIMYKPNSQNTIDLFDKFVKNPVLNHEKTEEWSYYRDFSKSDQMTLILKQGRAEFQRAFNDGKSDLHLPQSDMVDLYCNRKTTGLH